MLPTRRALFLIALLSLPAVALLAWWGIVQLDLQRIPAPRWDLPAKGMICWGDHEFSGASPGDPPPKRVSETPPGTFPADRAALIAQHVINRQIGGQDLFSFVFFGQGPTLMQTTFPDGEQRLAWRRVSVISDTGMSGVAAAVYLDAATGEPLALVRDIPVCEPSWTPLFHEADNKYLRQVWLHTSGQFVLLALYVAVVLFIVGVVLGIRGVVPGIRWLRARASGARRSQMDVRGETPLAKSHPYCSGEVRMKPSSPNHESNTRRATGVWYVIAALVVFVASLILLATQPIWLAPPAHAGTLAIYAILTLTWIPILDRGLRRLFTSRILFAILAVLMVPMQCGACLLFSRGELPVKMTAIYLSPLGKLDCQSFSSPERNGTYSCKLVYGSSDSPTLYVWTYQFLTWRGVPFMVKTDEQFHIECDPHSPTCSESRQLLSLRRSSRREASYRDQAGPAARFRYAAAQLLNQRRLPGLSSSTMLDFRPTVIARA